MKTFFKEMLASEMAKESVSDLIEILAYFTRCDYSIEVDALLERINREDLKNNMNASDLATLSRVYQDLIPPKTKVLEESSRLRRKRDSALKKAREKATILDLPKLIETYKKLAEAEESLGHSSEATNLKNTEKELSERLKKSREEDKEEDK